MISTHDRSLFDRLHRVGGHRRVSGALRALAFDLIEPDARDSLCTHDRDCLCDLVREPVESATSLALDALVRDLDRALAGADPGLLQRVEVLRRRAALGVE